jgi:hypothetical protein
MNSLVLAIIVFFVISIITTNKAKMTNNKQPGRRPWEELWQPPTAPPRRVSVGQRGPAIPPWQLPGDLDPDKDTELIQASGKEGEWGDEGRPDKSDFNSYEGQTFNPQFPNPQPSPTPIKVDQDPSPGLGWITSEPPLVQGVIWSEVLGRPRALRPHRGTRG